VYNKNNSDVCLTNNCNFYFLEQRKAENQSLEEKLANYG